MSEFDLRRDGRTGHLVVDDEDAARAVNLLKGGGFEVEGDVPEVMAVPPFVPVVEEVEADEFVRLEECVPEKPRPCDVATAIGYARDLAEDVGFDAPKVRALIDQGGYHNEEEVREALAEAAANAPAGDPRLEAAFLLGKTFGADALPADLTAEERATVQDLLAQPDSEA